MATATTLTSWDAALKQYYRARAVDDLVYKSHPLFELLPKDPKFRGRNMPIPILYGRGQGVSANFANAQSYATASKIDDFLLTRVSKYGVATISGEAVAASEGDRYSFLSASTTEIDNIIKSVGASVSTSLYRDGSGAIGQCNASVSSTSLVLKTTNDVVNFEVGMELQFCATKTGSSVKSGSVTITAINRNSGTLTVDALSAIDGGSGVAASDYIYQYGDYDGAISGLDAWIPSSAPGATSFFGVDRSVDTTRLGGQRYDGSSDTIIESLIEGMAIVGREGGTPSHIFLSYSEFVKLEKALGAQIKREVQRKDSISGYASLEMIGPSGSCEVIPDKDCPDSVAYILQMDTWTLASIGEVVQLTQLDGNRVLRQASDDGIEVRVHSYANLGCGGPGWNCRVTLPS
tara:strand:- start:154 stop:1368 length:1215 start_codon:yes stop_codon:yes gene_type:complete